MSNIEFISAKDLPISEAEEVDVLCVENGELKRKEGTSLGGGSGKVDAIIRRMPVFVDTGSDGWCADGSTITLEQGDYEAMKQKLRNDEPITIKYIDEMPEDNPEPANPDFKPFKNIEIISNCSYNSSAQLWVDPNSDYPVETECIGFYSNWDDTWYGITPDNIIARGEMI